MHTLQRIAEDNGRPMLLGRLIVDDMGQNERGRMKDLLMPEMRKTTLLLWFIWYGRDNKGNATGLLITL